VTFQLSQAVSARLKPGDTVVWKATLSKDTEVTIDQGGTLLVPNAPAPAEGSEIAVTATVRHKNGENDLPLEAVHIRVVYRRLDAPASVVPGDQVRFRIVSYPPAFRQGDF
jgi:hypothetical protein